MPEQARGMLKPTFIDLAFTLEEVLGRAQQLAYESEPVVAYRLLHEVLRLPPGEPELVQAKQAAMNSKWVHQLEAAQLADGSFERFHTQDTKVKTVFRTTEEAIDRGVALGLDVNDDALAKVRDYILDVLRAKKHITDWSEKNDAFPVLIKFILAGRLAQLDPHNNILGLFWVYLEEVAEQTFASGQYNFEDEAEAYKSLSGINVKRGFIHSQHALWILSARELPGWLNLALVDWIYRQPEGIGYLGAPLSEPNPRQLWYWLRSMNLFTRFTGWQEVACGSLNWLWDQRNGNGLWDFGNEPSRRVDFPISDSWRRSGAREQDYSSSILALLRKVFD